MGRVKEQQEQFCVEWLKSHFEAQPADNNSLTWVVAAWSPFRAYIAYADRTGYQPLTLSDFSKLLVKQFPNAKGKLLKGSPVFTGVRYFEDKLGGKLVLGI